LLYRLFIRLSAFCVEEYCVVHSHLLPELRRFGIKKSIRILPHPLNHTQKYEKTEHKGFNILNYCPVGKEEKWNKWIYGYDIYKQVKDYYQKDTDINFIRSYGQYDLEVTYPVIDFMLRPNRHDGDARMIGEAQIQCIPFYWSYENPCFDDIIKKIEYARSRTNNN
jgi:hypothetical protein